jgi:CheY-like chemotaxis protein
VPDLGARRRRVLVVDDNRDSADTMVQLLMLMGHEARACYGGAAALQAAEQAPPQVVLLDLNMPDSDGYTVLRDLRGRSDGAEFFIAAMTGYGQKADRDNTLAAGFDAHLTKPVDVVQLRDMLLAASEPKTAPG